MAMASLITLLLHIMLGCEAQIIISEHGVDTPSCLTATEPQYLHNSCHSLEYVANESNKLITIAYANLPINGTIVFVGVENVTISGTGVHATQINCSTKSGLVFRDSFDITLEKLAFNNCGISGWPAAAAILFQNCSNVSLSNIEVTKSKGYGVMLNNTTGHVKINGSSFTLNSAKDYAFNGGGIRILLDSTCPLSKSRYVISNCNFSNNSAIGTKVQRGQHTKNIGGGVSLLLFGNCTESHFEISNCNFTQNEAIYGGGLSTVCSQHSFSNTVIVLSNRFENNVAQNRSGGAVNILFRSSQTYITFHNNSFSKNTAIYGGGLDIFLFHLSQQSNTSHIIIKDSRFSDNTGIGGAAMNIDLDMKQSGGPMFLPQIYISNCEFEKNRIIKVGSKSDISNGAFYINRVPITFNGSISFQNNTGTALFANSAHLSFTNSSQLNFHNNSGDYGGAVHLQCGSQLMIERNVSFNFNKNTASHGGAIYIFTDEIHSFRYEDSCFNPNQTEVDFYFTSNTATSGIGNDMFISTIQSCINKCKSPHNQAVNSTQLLTNSSCIGQFHFSDNNNINITDHVATGPKRMTYKNDTNEELSLFPGIDFPLYITVYDELNGNVTDMYSLNARLENVTDMFIPHQYRYIGTKKVINITGSPGQTGDLVLETAGVTKRLKANLATCPPCFALESNSTIKKCSCVSGSRKIHCYGNNAQIVAGNWIGRLDESQSSELFIGACAVELCNSRKSEITLPKYYDQIDKEICYEGRIGTLCTKCNSNKSVYYMSRNYTCGKNSECSYGILKYIAFELIPVTILFLTILCLGIKFTSGALGSFLLCAQILSLSNIMYFEVQNSLPKHEVHILNTLELFYGFFNMDLTSFGFLEFCIVETNSIMNLFLFKYLTILYAFLLVVMTIYIMKLNIFNKMCHFYGRRNIRGSIVDGISAFLVICYVQCAKTTINILNWARLEQFALNQTSVRNIRNVHLYDGDLDFITGSWYYVLPAILCTIFVLLPPPFILMFEPLLTKMFSLKYFTHTSCKRLYENCRLMLLPFLDSFQSCFKDKHRYFAGLYFIYRISRPFTASILYQQITNSNALTLELFIIIFIHILVRPYKRKWHNLLEISLFLIILLMLYMEHLNYKNLTITSLKCKSEKNTSDRCKNLGTAVSIQLVLFSLPLVYLFGYTFICVLTKISKLQCCRRLMPLTRWNQNDPDYDFGFPNRLLNDASTSYDSF